MTDVANTPTSPKVAPCFVCGKALESVFKNDHATKYENMPRDAVVFDTMGNYGSKVWDELHGPRLVINICDGCVLEGVRDKRAILKDARTTTEYTYEWAELDEEGMLPGNG